MELRAWGRWSWSCAQGGNVCIEGLRSRVKADVRELANSEAHISAQLPAGESSQHSVSARGEKLCSLAHPSYISPEGP